MTYKISQSDPSKMTAEELHDEIYSFVKLAEEVVVRLSALLAEYRKRNLPHPFFRHPVLQFFKSIVDHSLDPKAAILLASRELIAAVEPLPHKKQVEIAEGAVVPVVVVTETGVYGIESMPIRRMDQPTLKRVFGPDGVRSVPEQTEILRKEGQPRRFGAITVVRDEMVLKIGNQKIRPEDLRAPLLALGFSLDLARNVEAKAG